MDIFVSLAAILVLLPFLLAVAFLIRMDSKGPALFTQLRWGKGGKKYAPTSLGLCEQIFATALAFSRQSWATHT